VHWTVDLLALGAASLALYFNLRLKRNYFLDSKYFLAFANTCFILIILEHIVSTLSNTPSSITFFVVLNGAMAAFVGIASFMLERRTLGTVFRELAEFLRNPPRIFTVYISIVLSWTVASVVLYPFQLRQSPGPEGTMYYYTFEQWWLVFSAVLVGSFFAGPVYSLYRQSLRITDVKVLHSMRILVFCWTGFGIMEFIRGTAGPNSPLVQPLGAVVDSLLFMLISLALREPTLLGRIISSIEVLNQAVNSANTDTVVLYSADSDRRKLAENFARQEPAKGQSAVCFVPKSDVPLYTVFLREASPVSSKQKVDVQPIEATLGIGEGNVLHPGFSRGTRELIDLGELDADLCRRTIAKVRAMDTLPGPSRKGRVWAVRVEGTGPEIVDELRRYSPNARVINPAFHQDFFSRLVGMEHQDLLGNRVLVEYDPSSNFESMVLKFVLEFQANVDPVAVFTSAGSPTHTLIRGSHNVRLFTGSTKTSTPLKLSEEEVLLPERDTSLLIDAVDKLLEAYKGRPVGIAIDLITDLSLAQGFDRAYGVLSTISEMAEAEHATLLVLVNRFALDETILNGIRGLFRFQLSYDEGGLKPVRLPSTGTRRTEDSQSLSTGQSVSVA
jgi:hypothetical protein